ncbi:recombinase family protein [Streptomyces sp. NPDC048416]|uniref:recombinase family protein n=1 Tax=Streptomyces sp. NPDC048416 TaxID=3365546 RepID=UPI00371C3A68
MRRVSAPRLRGRAPYGYRIASAAEGDRRLLVPDERTAPVVLRIFTEYLSRKGLQNIAEGLTADGIPRPGGQGSDGERQPDPWSKGTVRSILINPRYAGRSTAGGGAPAPCEPILPAATFEQVHRMFAARRTGDEPAAAVPGNRYLLRGLVRCARCNRLMQGTKNNGENYYRCRVPAESAVVNRPAHPRNVYVREQAVVGSVTAWLRAACTTRGLTQILGEPADRRHAAAAEATAGLLRNLTSDDQDPGEVFRALDLRITYADLARTVQAKAVLVPGGPVFRATLPL